jgi:hypothetical protein
MDETVLGKTLPIAESEAESRGGATIDPAVMARDVIIGICDEAKVGGLALNEDEDAVAMGT